MSSREEGAATVWMAIVCVLIGLGSALAFLLASVVVARHRAGSAADLAALAGADRLTTGSTPTQACATARRVASADGAELVTCTAQGGAVFVRVQVVLRGVLSRFGTVDAVARAGPASRSAS